MVASGEQQMRTFVVHAKFGDGFAVARHGAPSLHKPASVARSRFAAPAVRQAKNARQASRSQSRAVAHRRVFELKR